MNSMVNAVKTGGNQMKSSAESDGTQAGKNFATGISSAKGAVSSAVSSLVSTAVNRARQGAIAMRSAGSYIGQGLAQGMMSALGAVTAAANALVAQAERAARAKAEIRSPSRLFRDNVGIYIGQGIAVGIERSQKYVDEAMNGMFDTINSFDFATRQGASAMRSAGSYIGQGLAQGMMSALGAVTAAANALVAQAERAARAKAEIKSPSRLFRDNVGIYIGQGVAVGIERSQKYVDEAMNGMFDTINSFDFASTGLFDSNLALDLRGCVD